MNTQKISLAIISLLSATSLTPAVASESIPSVVVTVENAQPSRGTFLTPPWLAIHDGTFDTYNGGEPASSPLGGNEIEAVAEDGNNGPLAATFTSAFPNAPEVPALIGPAGPLAPGDKASITFNVDPSVDRYFSYASMIIPSNDFFIANGNPLAHQLFNGRGRFVGQDFIVSGDETNDAGTEVNDEIAANVAFLNQGGANIGQTENGVVLTPAPGFAAPGALAYPDGVLNYPVFGNGDFNDADDAIFKVSFRYVDLGGIVPFRASLSAAQEVGPEIIDSRGRGNASILAYDGKRALVRVRTRNLTGPIVAAHLHRGQAGTNGPVVVDMGPGIRGNSVFFWVSAADLVDSLDGESVLSLINEMAAGNIYVNIHTAANPGGEIRGQVALPRQNRARLDDHY